jgi:hypothetical protein
VCGTSKEEENEKKAAAKWANTTFLTQSQAVDFLITLPPNLCKSH